VDGRKGDKATDRNEQRHVEDVDGFEDGVLIKAFGAIDDVLQDVAVDDQKDEDAFGVIKKLISRVC